MKKLLLSIIAVAFAFTANAQDGKFNAGIQLGIPTGNAGDVTSFVAGLDLNYMFNVSENFDLGLATGYVHYFGKSVDIAGLGTVDASDVSFLPLAAAARFNASEDFVLGADLGYAVGISPDGNEGDFYFRPLVGYNLGDNMQLNASYSGIGDGGHFGLGLMFGL